MLANARDVLARLERYELEVFADDEQLGAAALEKAAARAGRRKAAAQASLFDLVNQKVIDELRDVDPDTLSPDEAKELLHVRKG